MHVGNCFVWNMESVLMGDSHPNKAMYPLIAHSRHSFQKLVQESMCLDV